MIDRGGKARALIEALTIVLVAAGVAVVLPLAVITVIAGAGFELKPALGLLLSILLIQGVSFGGVALLYLALRRGSIRVPLRWPTAVAPTKTRPRNPTRLATGTQLRQAASGPCGKFGIRSRRQTRRRCVGQVCNRVAIPALARLAPARLAVLHSYRTSRMAH